ncbi:hypothetical protein [Bifidobacterium stellenboschense]|uniref:Uncharacterized protein n=1 Tax=Bifidobacterium stellenboschense TaxID=762211 RepID=A0A087DGB0_9BIFI|nr:hypothetical protein [Bifidobacterium stellenboschense]KFI94560.1 hypothetical protein BSTEL_1230 [Bifidobacterium stellenboschense]
MFNTSLPWYLRMPNRLRTVAPGTDAGGTGGENGGQSGTDDTDDGTDWKAKFEAERAHSRKWEQHERSGPDTGDITPVGIRSIQRISRFPVSVG